MPRTAFHRVPLSTARTKFHARAAVLQDQLNYGFTALDSDLNSAKAELQQGLVDTLGTRFVTEFAGFKTHFENTLNAAKAELLQRLGKLDTLETRFIAELAILKAHFENCLQAAKTECVTLAQECLDRKLSPIIQDLDNIKMQLDKLPTISQQVQQILERMSQLQQTSPPSDQAEKPAAESNPSQQSRRSQRPT